MEDPLYDKATTTRRSVLGGTLAGAFTVVASGLAASSSFAAGQSRNGRDDVPLVTGQVAAAVLVLSPAATDQERLAAAEIQAHVRQMTGAVLPIGSDPKAAANQVYVGQACPDPRLDLLAGQTPDSFRIAAAGSSVQLAGLSDAGTLFAAYELLEQLGVRWLMPGPHGTVTPVRPTLRAKAQDSLHIPKFSSRQIHFVDRYLGKIPPGVDPLEGVDWARRRRLRGESWSAHGIKLLPPASSKTEPQLYIHENGVPTAQLDVTNPDVLRRAIAAVRAQMAEEPHRRYVSMGPADGHGFGTSEWDAGDIDPLTGDLSVTDRYIKFFNLVLDDLQRDYPELGISFFCYDNYMRPPVREVPNRRILPVVAPINVDRLHTAADPSGWERRYYFRMVDRWRELVDEWTYRGYLFNLADPGLPFIAVPQSRDEFPMMVEHGSSQGLRVEGSASWGYDGPAYYLATKLMWDPGADVVPILADYMKAAYGPAAAEMAAYYAAIIEVVSDAPYSAGRWFDHLAIFGPDVVSRLDARLADAERIAAGSGDAGVIDRVAISRLAFNVGSAFLGTLRSWRDFDFAAAKDSRDAAKVAFTAAVSHQPVALYPLRNNFLIKMDGPVDEAFDRVTGENRLIAALPDSWSALLDSDDRAEADQIYAVDVPISGFRPLHTRSRSWSAQGLRYFKGVMWYRTSVELAADLRDRRVLLWLGSVDEKARVWVNGHEVPLDHGSAAFQPWEFDLTGYLQFTGANEIALKVTNVRLQELGTGGLLGPAFLWSPPQPVTPVEAPAPVQRGSGFPNPDRAPAPPATVPPALRIRELPDAWFAMADPSGKAAELGLWEAVIPTESQWMTLLTKSKTWNQQGLGYYDGGMVYRTGLKLSGRDIDETARLLFTRLNGAARVWLNDRELSVASNGSASGTWEFLAGPHLKPGENTVVVSLAAPAEGRPGGISGPVYLVKR